MLKMDARAIRAPMKFDVFSIGLVFCQLLFNLLDDRTDAGFRQQLDDADYDINSWLERELQATLRNVSSIGRHCTPVFQSCGPSNCSSSVFFVARIRRDLKMDWNIWGGDLALGDCYRKCC